MRVSLCVWVVKIYLLSLNRHQLNDSIYKEISAVSHFSWQKNEDEFYVKLYWSIIVNFSFILFHFCMQKKKPPALYNFFFLSFIACHMASCTLICTSNAMSHNHIQTTHKTFFHRSNFFFFFRLTFSFHLITFVEAE